MTTQLPKSADWRTPVSAPWHILVVTDDQPCAAHCAALLRGEGYSVETADSVVAAMQQLREHPADLVLTDIVMPGGMNGRDLAVKLRERWPDLKVLYTSGYAYGATLEPLNGRGSHFIGKPFRRRDLAAKVREVLDEVPAAPARGAA